MRRVAVACAAIVVIGGASAIWYMAAENEPGPALSRCLTERTAFEGRDYLACGSGERVLVFLHGMLAGDPLSSAPANLERLITWGAENATTIVIPTAATRCDDLDPPRPDFRCWPGRRVREDVEYLYRLLEHIAKRRGLTWEVVVFAGYSNGGYFLSKALQRGLLDEVDRVGLLVGGTPDRELAAGRGSPEVFVEIAKNDRWNAPWGRQLVPKLEREGYRVRAREVDGGHEYDAPRLTEFLVWLAPADP